MPARNVPPRHTHYSPVSRKRKVSGCLLVLASVLLVPNATLQAPPIAGARYERRLLAVACKRWLGHAPRPAPDPSHPRSGAQGVRRG